MGVQGLSGPLYHKNQVPEHFHELFIYRGYRNPKSSISQCILSLFDLTNETLNFWTHFIPSIYFAWTLVDLSHTIDFVHDPFTWPLLSYLIAICIFPMASAVAHTFNVMSDEARHICFFVDYAAISIFSIGSAIAYFGYVFPKDVQVTWFGQNYLNIALACSVLMTITSCETRFMKPSFLRKVLRMSTFFVPYTIVTIPVYYRLLASPEDVRQLESQHLLLRHCVLAFISAFLYGTHYPERMFPGQFDIVGHSHQLFHITSVIGTRDMLSAILSDMKDRPGLESATFFSSVGLVAVCLIVNCLFICFFAWRLCRKPPVTKYDSLSNGKCKRH